MHRQLQTSPGRANRRGGFSLIELMIVIVVIALLIGMAFPAFNAVQRRAQITAVSVEIKNLEEAIARFEQAYGGAPPSFVVIAEGGSAPAVVSTNKWPSTGGGPGARISRARLKAIWQQLDFSSYGEPFDYNGDGDTTDPGEDDGGVDFDDYGAYPSNTPTPRPGSVGVADDINDLHYLNGAECLVFFLGGACTREDLDGNGDFEFVPQGFSTNPRNPFILPHNDKGVASGSRVGPFYEFDPQRLVDTDGDGFPEYVDSLPNQTAPYQYFSSYGGTGYSPRGLNDVFDNVTSGVSDDEMVPGGLQSHYILADSNTSGSGFPTPATNNSVHKPQSYQIISPGFDGLYGVGGAYVDGKPISANPDPTGQRTLRIQEESDNITNFSSGTLQ